MKANASLLFVVTQACHCFPLLRTLLQNSRSDKKTSASSSFTLQSRKRKELASSFPLSATPQTASFFPPSMSITTGHSPNTQSSQCYASDAAVRERVRLCPERRKTFFPQGIVESRVSNKQEYRHLIDRRGADFLIRKNEEEFWSLLIRKRRRKSPFNTLTGREREERRKCICALLLP